MEQVIFKEAGDTLILKRERYKYSISDGFRLVRDSTAIFSRDNSATATYYLGTLNADIRFANNITYLDSPATTSATTYKTQFGNAPGGGTCSVQVNNDVSTITLMEIAA
jgi:hypothetical protein